MAEQLKQTQGPEKFGGQEDIKKMQELIAGNENAFTDESGLGGLHNAPETLNKPEIFDFKAKYEQVKSLNEQLKSLSNSKGDFEKDLEIHKELDDISGEINKAYGLGLNNDHWSQLKTLENGQLQITMSGINDEGIKVNIEKDKATKVIYDEGTSGSIKSTEVFYKNNLWNSESEKLYTENLDKVYNLQMEANLILEDIKVAIDKTTNPIEKDKIYEEMGKPYREKKLEQSKIGEELLKTVGITLKPGQIVSQLWIGEGPYKGEIGINIVERIDENAMQVVATYSVDPAKKIFRKTYEKKWHN